MKFRLNKTYSALLRLTIGIGITFYLFRKIGVGQLSDVLAECGKRWEWLVVAIMICFVCLLLGNIRWKIILDAQGLAMSPARVFRVYFIGQFFNAFMFGATGGDLVRAFYAAKETHHLKTEAVATVILDRAIGLIVIITIAAFMLIFRASFFLDHPQTHLPAILMIIMIGLAFLGLIFLFNIQRFKNWPIFKQINNSRLLGPTIKRFLSAINLYRRHTRVLVYTILISLVGQLLIVFECYCLGKSFQITIGFIDYLTIVPIILSISAIPITPGGLGIREGLSVALLGAFGIITAKALPLSLMVYFSALVWSLLGGIIFLGYSASSGHTVHDEILELRSEASDENGDIGVTGAHE